MIAPLRQLRRVWWWWSAWRLAAFRPLGYFPGWRFGIAEEGIRDEHTQKRLNLWWFCNNARLELPLTVRWYEGLRLRMYLGNDLSRCLFVGGCYEPNEFAFLAEAIEPGMTFADIGANDGLYTLFASRRVGPTGTVLAFEPSRREYTRLQANLRLNRIKNARRYRVALGCDKGTAALRVAGYEHAGHNTLGQFIYEGVECAGMESVPVERLDDVVARDELPAPDVIKMDVEGAELAVFRGATRILETARPLLLFELTDAALQRQGASKTEVLSFLDRLGYRLFVFDPTTGRPVPAHGGELSPNVVAVHPSRPWRCLPNV